MNRNNLSLRERLYYCLFYNPFFKKISISLLNSSWLVNNPAYQFLNGIRIKSLIKKYVGKPNFVFIEITNLCNSHCLVCPHDKMKRAKGVMKWELFMKVIGQCREMRVDNISLHGFGEPFTDKDFTKKLSYAKKMGFKNIGTSTNGSLLNKNIIEQLVKLELDEINFSLDAYSREVYKELRRGLPYDLVMKNIEELVQIREKYGKNKPKIIVDFIETEQNKKEKGAFISRWRNIADRVNITTLHSWGGELKGKTGVASLHIRSDISRDPCRFLWTDMYVNWDGRVNACCQDFNSELIIGDINKTSLKEIWNGKRIKKLRKFHLAGKADKISLCQKCDYRSVWWLFK